MQVKSIQIINAEAKTSKEINNTGYDAIKSGLEETAKNVAMIFDEAVNLKKIEEQASAREVELMLEKAKTEESFHDTGLSTTERKVEDAYSEYEKYKNNYEKEYGKK